MDITTSLLCDFAQVREGLLFVSSGGITRVYRDEFPAPMGLALAVVVNMDEIESRRPHQIEVFVLDEDGQEVTRLQGEFQTTGHDLFPGENLHVPFALDCRMVGLSKAGTHDVRIYIDGNHHRTLTFLAAPTPGTPS